MDNQKQAALKHQFYLSVYSYFLSLNFKVITSTMVKNLFDHLHKPLYSITLQSYYKLTFHNLLKYNIFYFCSILGRIYQVFNSARIVNRALSVQSHQASNPVAVGFLDKTGFSIDEQKTSKC